MHLPRPRHALHGVPRRTRLPRRVLKAIADHYQLIWAIVVFSADPEPPRQRPRGDHQIVTHQVQAHRTTSAVPILLNEALILSLEKIFQGTVLGGLFGRIKEPGYHELRLMPTFRPQSRSYL